MPFSCATEVIGEPFGTSSADPSGLAWYAPTIAILLPPAAANTGGALPTPPTSTDPAPMACSIGGPEVKSDQDTLNGSLPISPAPVSSACAPVPAWSPTCSVTPDTSAWFAPLVPDELAVAPPTSPAADDDEEEEHAVSTAKLAAAARASTRFVRFINVLPNRRRAPSAGGA